MASLEAVSARESRVGGGRGTPSAIWRQRTRGYRPPAKQRSDSQGSSHSSTASTASGGKDPGPPPPRSAPNSCGSQGGVLTYRRPPPPLTVHLLFLALRRDGARTRPARPISASGGHSGLTASAARCSVKCRCSCRQDCPDLTNGSRRGRPQSASTPSSTARVCASTPCCSHTNAQGPRQHTIAVDWGPLPGRELICHVYISQL